MARKTLNVQDADALVSIGSRLYEQLTRHDEAVIEATGAGDPGALADAIAQAKADLGRAYVGVTALVSRQS